MEHFLRYIKNREMESSTVRAIFADSNLQTVEVEQGVISSNLVVARNLFVCLEFQPVVGIDKCTCVIKFQE